MHRIVSSSVIVDSWTQYAKSREGLDLSILYRLMASQSEINMPIQCSRQPSLNHVQVLDKWRDPITQYPLMFLNYKNKNPDNTLKAQTGTDTCSPNSPVFWDSCIYLPCPIT